jgi:hypothetical protein
VSEWISVKDAFPHDRAIVECLGNPTICCEQDMDEQEVLKCVFRMKISSYRINGHNQIEDIKMYDEFEVIEDAPRRHMINVVHWKPSED